MIVVGILIGLVLGALAAWLALRAQLVQGRAHAAEAARLLDENRRLDDDSRALDRRLAEAEALLQAERGSLDERVTAAVRAASSEAFRHNSDAFLGLAETKLDAYVKPLKESLGKVETQVSALERSRQEAYGALNEGVRQLRADQERLRAETGNLVTALRAPHVRGRWGEIQLKRVIEMAGMLPHCDFEEQATSTDADGKTLRPDVVVSLPGGKSVVIDSKVPLMAYLEAFAEGVDDDQRRAHLADHARQVRDHVTKLGQKAYWRQLPATPEFVVMFLPDETFLRAAVEHDPSLIEMAIANNVIPASPDQPDRPAARRALRLAAGDDRRERAPGERPRSRAVPPHLDDGRARREARQVARRRRARRTTRPSARSRRGCCRRRARSRSTGSRASTRPSSCRSSVPPAS